MSKSEIFITNAINKFTDSQSLNEADRYEASLKHLIKFFEKDDILLLLEKSPNNYSNQYRSNQLEGKENLFVKTYLLTKDQYQELIPNWQEFALKDFLSDAERLKWVIEGNDINDFVEETVSVEDLF